MRTNLVVKEAAIALLKRNGRASYSELARELDCSRAQVASVIGPMLDDGSLRPIATIHPKLLELNVLAYLSVQVSGDTRQVIDSISQLPSAVFVSETTGKYQITAELHNVNLTGLQANLRLVRALENVIEVDVLLCEKMLSGFSNSGSALSPGRKLDKADAVIMAEMQRDGRIPYSDLAAKSGMSVAATRARVVQLLKSGAMQVGVAQGRSTQGSALVFGIGVNLSGAEHRVIELLRGYSGSEFIACTVGRFDVLASISFPILEEFNSVIASLRNVKEAYSVQSWLHVKVHVERYLHSVHGDWITWE